MELVWEAIEIIGFSGALSMLVLEGHAMVGVNVTNGF